MNQFINQLVTFGYDGNQRNVLVEKVKVTKDKKTILVGRDLDRNDEYRSFSAEKIQDIGVMSCGKTHRVPEGWGHI